MKPQILPPALALTILINRCIISAFTSNTSKGLFVCIQNKGNLELSWSWFGSCVPGGWAGRHGFCFPCSLLPFLPQWAMLLSMSRVFSCHSCSRLGQLHPVLSHGCQHLDLDCSSSLIVSHSASSALPLDSCFLCLMYWVPTLPF